MEIKIDQSKNSSRRKFQDRNDHNRYSEPTGSIVEMQYERLQLTTIVDFAKVFSKEAFQILF